MRKGFLAAGMVLATVIFPTLAQAGVIVSFDARVNGFVPGPLPGSTVFSGQFTIDDSVTPSAGGVKYFHGALDDFSVTIAGQTFGGTNGRYTQFTNASGVGGFIGGALGNAGFGTFGTTSGTFFDGTDTWNFAGMSLDWRGAAADIFPGGDPALIGTGFGRSNDGITANDEINYALMNLRFVNAADGTTFNNALNVSFSRIEYAGPPMNVPEPAPVMLLLAGLFAMAGRHRTARRGVC